jgi:hypothetical protein
MFEGFTEFDLKVAWTRIYGRYCGSGPLLLHGIPETFVIWHLIAPGSPEASPSPPTIISTNVFRRVA